MVGETLAELTSQCAQFSESETLVVPETQKSRENHLQKRLSTQELPSSQPPTLRDLYDIQETNVRQNLRKEMEEIKRFTKSTERKFEELEMALQNISGKKCNYNNNENSLQLLEILKNLISNLEKELIGKDAIINFPLKQENETSNNTSSVNKTVTENDEILENERENSRSNPNSK